jgi:hypothetical protein
VSAGSVGFLLLASSANIISKLQSYEKYILFNEFYLILFLIVNNLASFGYCPCGKFGVLMLCMCCSLIFGGSEKNAREFSRDQVE